MAKHAHPPIFSEVLLEHKDSTEVMRVARALAVAERPYYPSGKQTLGEVIDGRWATPGKHDEGL